MGGHVLGRRSRRTLGETNHVSQLRAFLSGGTLNALPLRQMHPTVGERRRKSLLREMFHKEETQCC